MSTFSVERVEPGLGAILVVNVVGYSRLIGRDEAGTLAYEDAPPRLGRTQDGGAQGSHCQHHGAQRRDKVAQAVGRRFNRVVSIADRERT
jgi:hypothetical protein